MKKGFVQVSLVLSLFLMTLAYSVAGSVNASALGVLSHEEHSEMRIGEALALNADGPEYAPRDSREKPKPSKASRKSQSRRHSGERSHSYSAPNSNSVRAGNLGGSRGTPTPSSISHTGGQGNPPLRMSMRDRYFGVGSREIGFNIGTAHGFTDVQGNKGLGFGESLQFQLQNPGLNFGVYTKLRMVEWFGLSLGLDYARITGEDDGKLADFEGFSFGNNLVEFNARIAFYAPLSSMTVFDIYAFAGLALFSHNLKLYDQDGAAYKPQEEYGKLQPALPFGLGLSWLVGTRMVIGYEIGYRYSAFNYLDGVAPADSPYDAYLFNTLKVGFILKPSGR